MNDARPSRSPPAPLCSRSRARLHLPLKRGERELMGLGSSFYGQFAPEQRAFVAQAVKSAAESQGLAAGDGAFPPQLVVSVAP